MGAMAWLPPAILNDNGIPVKIFMSGAEPRPLTRSMLEALDPSMSNLSLLENSGVEELIGLLSAEPAEGIFVDALFGSGINRPHDLGDL